MQIRQGELQRPEQSGRILKAKGCNTVKYAGAAAAAASAPAVARRKDAADNEPPRMRRAGIRILRAVVGW